MKRAPEVERRDRRSAAIDLLDEVRREVLGSLREEGDDQLEMVDRGMRHLIEWVGTEVFSPERASQEPLDPRQARRFAEALRFGLIRRWQRGRVSLRAEDCMAILGALARLEGGDLPDDARSFAARLSAPDGLGLVAELAHDLRSPLTSISFLAEALRSGHSGSVTEHQRSQLGLIYSASIALTSLVADVMDLADGAGGRLVQEEPEPFSIDALCRSVRDLVQPLAEEKQLEFRIRIETPDRVIGHPAALGRILTNLVINGLKFADHGWVEVAAEREGPDRVVFSVRDTGRGISEENQRRLFLPFRRTSHRDGAFFSSSGLGLSIVRRLLESMGSELELETRPNWGTRFHFSLRLPAVDDR